VIFVGTLSSVIGVESRRAGAASDAAFRLLYFDGAVLGVDFAGVPFLGVDAGFAIAIGEEARLFAADSRRSRAGRTRFWGTEDVGSSSAEGTGGAGNTIVTY
jgi:hypothetical protein